MERGGAGRVAGDKRENGRKFGPENLPGGFFPPLLRNLPKKEVNTDSNYLIFPTFAVPKIVSIMARVCQVTGKTPIGGNKVSHSNIKTKRRFLPNLQKKKFYLAEEDKWIVLKLSTEAIRTINKNGLYSVVKQLRAKGEKI